LVTGRQTEATLILLSNTMRGAFVGPVTRRVKACAAGDSTSASAVAHKSAVARPARGRRDVRPSAAIPGSRGVKVNADDIKTAPPDLNSAGHSWHGCLEGVYP
jgi:hypothetical protein